VEERVEKGDSSEEMTSVGSDSMEEATVEPILDGAWHNRVSSVFPTRQHGINNSGQMPLQQQQVPTQRTSSTAPRIQQSLSAEFYPIPATAHFIHHQPPPFSFSASHTPVSVVGSPQTNRRPPPRPRSASGVDAGFHPSVGYHQHSGGWDVYSPTADPAAPAAAMSSSPPNFPHNGFQVTPASPLSAMRTAPFEEKPSPSNSNTGNRGAAASAGRTPFHAAATLVRERQLNTPINFDQEVSPDVNDAPHYSEGSPTHPHRHSPSWRLLICFF
jgi:hypothetical protein